VLLHWRDALVIVEPATVGTRHRSGHHDHWRRESRSEHERPPIPIPAIVRIRRMSTEIVAWGAPRIEDELALLGHHLAISTFARCMVRRRRTESSQIRRAVLRDHMGETAARDRFVVPTVIFQRLSVCVVMSLE
jgi:hypothetical protein